MDIESDEEGTIREEAEKDTSKGKRFFCFWNYKNLFNLAGIAGFLYPE
jgi:hypothetical protein